MLNWIVRNRTVYNWTLLMLNWLVWNRTVLTLKYEFVLDWKKLKPFKCMKKWAQAHKEYWLYI